MNSYIVLPIFIDNYLHPLHKDNDLSLLYVKELNQESQILTFDHLDSLSEDNFDFLEDSIILTPNKKHLLSIHPFKTVYDQLISFSKRLIPMIADVADIFWNSPDTPDALRDGPWPVRRLILYRKYR